MKYLKDGIYSQVFFSDDLLLLMDIVKKETKRLWNDHDVVIVDETYKIRDDINKEGKLALVYSIEIFFKQINSNSLDPKALFGKYYDE